MTRVSNVYVPAEQIVLPDVSLAAIVRDEMMNPAGGVEDFIRSTVPYVREAIVVDTGSLDGTREKLEELQAEFLQLKVYDHDFRGFADIQDGSPASTFIGKLISYPIEWTIDGYSGIKAYFSNVKERAKEKKKGGRK